MQPLAIVPSLVNTAAPTPTATYAGVTPPLSGVKFYGQINAAMAQITGVALNNQATNTLYNQLQQSLPTTNDLSAFVASAQTAIAQLADAYCAAANKATLFPGLDATQTNPGTYFGAAPPAGTAATGNRALVINPLINNALGGATTSPEKAAILQDELNALITKLSAVTPAPTSGAVAQGACSAVLGSAVVSLQ